MSLTGLLCQVGLKQLFDVTSTEVAEWVDSRFKDSSRAVLRAVFDANQRSWTVIGLALAEKSFAGHIRDLIREADLKGVRDEIRQLIAATPAEHRTRAAGELAGLHDHYRSATTDALSGAEALFRRFADPAGLAAEADRAAGSLPDMLATDAPHLVVLLRFTPDGRTPLFQALFRYHFRKRLVKNTELSGLLLHDQVRHLTEQTDGRTAGILDHLDVMFEHLDAEQAREEGTRQKNLLGLQREPEEAERKPLLEENQKAEQKAKAKDPLHPLRRWEAGEKVELKLPADVVMRFAWCPAGSFRMGGRVHNDEQPIHNVTLTKGFYMGIYPVTQAEWKAVMGTDPSYFKGAIRPVESVTWHECNEFCTKLSGLLKWEITLRMPSEAEWEYACRAGTTTEYHFGNLINTDLANYDGNYSFNDSPKGISRKETTDIGSFPANSWGLYDFHGNVWEWCRDAKRTYSAADHTDQDGQSNDGTRVLRGGSWRYSPGYCRAAYRSRNTPAYRGCNCGFRVCFRLD